MKLSETLNRVIDLAGKVRDYYETELPKRHRHYPLISADEETAPPPPEEMELKRFFSTLSDDMILQLLLIMYLGRQDFGVDELAESFETFKREYADLEYAKLEMLGRPATLAYYLSDGLEELRSHKINVDKLPLKKMRIQKL
jgi:hypothetical protein